MEITFFRPGTGISFFTRVLQEYNLMPTRQESICIKIFKKTLVLLISFVTLPVICTYAITHYNAPALVTKSIAAISCLICRKAIFSHSCTEFFQDIKRHSAGIIIDFFVIVASPIFALLLLVKPDCIGSLNRKIALLC